MKYEVEFVFTMKTIRNFLIGVGLGLLIYTLFELIA